MQLKEKAVKLLEQFKGSDYAFGRDVLDRVGEYAAQFGSTALVIANLDHLKETVGRIMESLQKYGVKTAGEEIVPGAGLNSPQEDVYRLESYILHRQPDCIISIGGGSSIDATKGANVLASLGEYSPEIETYFGTGLISGALQKTGKSLRPLVAVQTAASSGAHLTKYSNITDLVTGQKKLIVDEAIVPSRAVFDYTVTRSMPESLTVDGALDGIAHLLEVFYGTGQDQFDMVKEIVETGLGLIVKYAHAAVEQPGDIEAREALGLGTDLGGNAIMVGGTNGAHLTSFSLVDITSHGRACGLMNPYYTVFFAPAIQRQLSVVGRIFKQAGFIRADLGKLDGCELGLAVAEGMMLFNQKIGAPVSLRELPGFSDDYIKRALNAAKNPQLEMKLKNMPVPLEASQVDEYMGPVLEAAAVGDFRLIKNLV